jgi:hypothetical protein
VLTPFLGPFLHMTMGYDQEPTQRSLRSFGLWAFSLHHSSILLNSELEKFRIEVRGIDGPCSLHRSTTHINFRLHASENSKTNFPQVTRSANYMNYAILFHMSIEHQRFWFNSGLCASGVPKSYSSTNIQSGFRRE